MKPVIILLALLVFGMAFSAVATEHTHGGKDKNKTNPPTPTPAATPAPATTPPTPELRDAPTFTLNDVAGKKVSLGDYKGKVVVLEWAGLDCPYTAKFYKDNVLQGWQDSYEAKGKDVVWLTIFTKVDASKVSEWIKANNDKSTDVLIDPDGAVAVKYEAKKTPFVAVVDKNGKIEYKGAIDDKPTSEAKDVATAKNLLKDALDEVLASKQVMMRLTYGYGTPIFREETKPAGPSMIPPKTDEKPAGGPAVNGDTK
jgi:peroxiredoxin